MMKPPRSSCLAAGALLGAVAMAHYAMIKPPAWQDPDGSHYADWDLSFGWRSAGCTNATPPAGEEGVMG